ncbi:PAS sensor-containing diguanylate cyclase/phosphodiesterase [Aliarcobacter cibarius]|uniref:PAS sensor-containing diguanylate cyclase/phosphodiesterase n=1 Tax=Aliarcobacter cibarius TaxID=255507 RepID=A0A7L5JNF6_9BACT|nr:EAL domain-containing protein [Aliarcobacter cibarius]QKJ26731.1 PAS sensor-containing diguanylate cyclase/phosphodiesterase [Aliarcobacter cibarius]
MNLEKLRQDAIEKAINQHYAVVSFKTDGTIRDANEKFLKLFGYELEEIVGKKHRIFCDSDYANSSEYIQFWNDLTNGYVQTEEFKRIKKDGTSIFIQASYKPLINEDGQIFEILKFAQDITSKKLESLDYSAKIKAINSTQSVIEFDMNGFVLNANENLLNSLGYSLDEIIGKHQSMFCEEDYVKSNEYKEFWNKLRSGIHESGKYLRLGKNGKKVWVQAIYTPIFDIDKKTIKIVNFTQDITQLEIMQKDSLTGFFNKEKLILDIPLNNQNNLAIINLDDFSQINDFYGHAIADQYILKFSKIFSVYLENKFSIYRIAEGTFAILDPNLTTTEFYNIFKNYIEQLKDTLIDLDIKKFSIVLTCGISSENNERLINTAEIVNKYAQKNLKNILVYSKDLNIEKEFEENIYWSENIRLALKQDRIIVYYQPIYNNELKKIEKYESLVRLKDKDGEIISPYKFLEISKKSKQYIDITKVVIEKSFSKFADSSYEFSINLTVEDILNEELNEFLFRKIDEYKVSNKLVIELVESEKITTYDPVYEFINKIKKKGCKVAIDDFGSGYSNFEYLVKIDADYVKIDGSIVKRILDDENSVEIIKSILNFCRKMDIKVVAEFISDEKLQAKVIELGISYSQGYYIGMPSDNID